MSSNFYATHIQFYFWLMKINISNHSDSQLSRSFNPVPISLDSPGSTATWKLFSILLQILHVLIGDHTFYQLASIIHTVNGDSKKIFVTNVSMYCVRIVENVYFSQKIIHQESNKTKRKAWPSLLLAFTDDLKLPYLPIQISCLSSNWGIK